MTDGRRRSTPLRTNEKEPGPAASCPFTVAHFADLHLDTGFAWAGAHGDAARNRREDLRDTLRRIVRVAVDAKADAIFCAGDLYEHDRVTPDTAAFLKDTFAGIAPLPVFLAPGNHDWYGPESIYATNDWSANVHVFREPRLQRIELRPGLTLWGGAHLAPRNTGNFLKDFHTTGAGLHLALFHGSEETWFTAQEDGKARHAPFDAAEIATAGLRHAFLGHYHRPRDADHHTYAGNPAPLAFGEEGERGAVVATIRGDGAIHRKRRRVCSTAVHDLHLDVTGCGSRQAVRDRLARRIDGLRGMVRLTVHGDVDPHVDLREADLRTSLENRFDAAQIRYDNLRPAYDIDAIRRERTVRGRFVSDVMESNLPKDERRRVVTAGLRALDGRSDLDVL